MVKTGGKMVNLVFECPLSKIFCFSEADNIYFLSGLGFFLLEPNILVKFPVLLEDVVLSAVTNEAKKKTC